MVIKQNLAIDGSNYSEGYLKLCVMLRLEDLLHILDDLEPDAKDKANPTDTKKKAQRKWNEQER